MDLNIDSKSVDFGCPSCGYKLTETIGRLKQDPTLRCVGCGKDIRIEADELRRAIDSVQRSFDELARTIRSLNKR